MFDEFDRFRSWTLQLGRLQRHLEALHKYTVAELELAKRRSPNVTAAAYGSAAGGPPGDGGGYRSPGAGPAPETPKHKSPYRGGYTTAATPSETKIYDAVDTRRNDNHDFQHPASPNAKRLPPPPAAASPKDAQDKVLGYVNDMRSMAIHFVSCARLLAAIADQIEPMVKKQR